MTLTLVGSCFAVLGLPVADGSTASVLYLKSPGVPTAALSASAPTAGSLPNYDPGRDDEPGLLLAKGDNGWQEHDHVKHQLWVAPAGAMSIDGGVSIEFWSAMKDMDDDKKGVIGAYLLECNPAGNNCALIGQGSSQKNPWSNSGSWVRRVIDFGHIDHDIPSGRALALKITVGNNSDDDMWLAYDTTSFPSALVINGSTTTTTTTTTAPPTTTTTAAPTTTTTAPPTTTTTTPPTTTTTEPPSNETDEASLLPAPTEPEDPAGPLNGSPASEISVLSFGGSSVTALLTQEPGLGALVSTLPTGQSGGEQIGLPFLEGLDLVIPPWASALSRSAMMVFGFIFAALTDSGRAILLPTSLLLVGMSAVIIESRWIRPVTTLWNGPAK
ncbi:MAG: hypothetical protein WEF28_11365 [Acidimicrobiia bacterium]